MIAALSLILALALGSARADLIAPPATLAAEQNRTADLPGPRLLLTEVPFTAEGEDRGWRPLQSAWPWHPWPPAPPAPEWPPAPHDPRAVPAPPLGSGAIGLALAGLVALARRRRRRSRQRELRRIFHVALWNVLPTSRRELPSPRVRQRACATRSKQTKFCDQTTEDRHVRQRANLRTTSYSGFV